MAKRPTHYRVDVLEPDGSISEATISRANELKEMQALVHGYIELVTVEYAGECRDAYVNEDGTHLGLRYNPRASTIYGAPIVGVMIVCMTGSPA